MRSLIVFQGNALWRSLFLSSTVVTFASCANVGGPGLQPQVNGLIVANRPKIAAEKIMAEEADYGAGNYVLYHLDRSLILQMNDDVAGSARSLEKAKARYEVLYTRSLSNEAAAWLVNDNTTPYRAPGYERVLMNVFQAFNFLEKGSFDEALVEMRDLDSKFPVDIDALAQKKRLFDDNGFARLLSGIIYEARGKGGDLSEAFVAYKQALSVYDVYYDKKYVPRVLQEGLIRLGERFNDAALAEYRARFGTAYTGEDASVAVVYFFEAVGFSPMKVPEIVPVPLDRGLITQLAFPKFIRRVYETQASELRLDDGQGRVFRLSTELGADIEGIAEKDLEARKALILTKSSLRPAIKYLVERNQKEVIKKKYGVLASQAFGLLSNIYNIYTEQADLRSWQALPGQVRLARIAVPPGSYRIYGQDLDAHGVVVDRWEGDQLRLGPGQVSFLFRRGVR